MASFLVFLAPFFFLSLPESELLSDESLSDDDDEEEPLESSFLFFPGDFLTLLGLAAPGSLSPSDARRLLLAACLPASSSTLGATLGASSFAALSFSGFRDGDLDFSSSLTPPFRFAGDLFKTTT